MITLKHLIPAAVFLCTSNALASEPLDVVKNVDHVVTLVRPENYVPARIALSKDLGFRISPGLVSPMGTRNTLIWFEDLSYLEIATYAEVNEFTAPIVSFLDTYEGAKIYATEVSSSEDAEHFFSDLGLDTSGVLIAPPLFLEHTGEMLPSPLWSQLLFLGPAAPDDSWFVIDYCESELEELFTEHPELAPQEHPNTAERLDALWLVVTDLQSAEAFYRSLGLQIGWRNRWFPDLGARATIVRHGSSDIILMEPGRPGIIGDFAAERGQGIAGARIEVRDLDRALHLIRTRTGRNFQVFRRDGDRAFRIPAEMTYGLTLELFEPLRPHKSQTAPK